MKWSLWCQLQERCFHVRLLVNNNNMCVQHSQRIQHCYPEGYAAPSDVPCQCNMWRSPSKLKSTLPQSKIHVTSKSPVGDISVVTLIRTDTTLDHSQEAGKVYIYIDCPGVTNTKTFSLACLLCTRTVGWVLLLGQGPHKNCKNDLDDQTWRELE